MYLHCPQVIDLVMKEEACRCVIIGFPTDYPSPIIGFFARSIWVPIGDGLASHLLLTKSGLYDRM